MKRSEKAKAGPKFRVGQLVCAKFKLSNSSGTLVRCFAGDVLRVEKSEPLILSGFLVVRRVNIGDTFATRTDEVRPLTLRESGQCQRKGSK